MARTAAAPTVEPTAAIREIEQLGLTWRQEPSYDLTELSTDRRLQIRDSHKIVPKDAAKPRPEDYAPKVTVERFSVQMEYSQFPPIIVTEDAWIVDGNTRVGASLKRGQRFFPAYVINAYWDAPHNAREQNLLRVLASTLNSNSGEPLSPDEVRRNVRYCLDLQLTTEQIARRYGLAIGKITQVRRELDASRKLDRLGLRSNGQSGLRAASLRALGHGATLALNDAPYRALATLARDAGLNATEIQDVAKLARETGSDTAALDVLASQRSEMAERIKERELTGVGKPPLVRQLRQHLGFINRYAEKSGTEYAGRFGELVERNPDWVEAHMDALESAMATLSLVIEAQQAASRA